MNYALIFVNGVIFLLTYWPRKNPYTGAVVSVLRPWAEHFMLNPTRPHLWQFISYAFLHGNEMHIIGNMFFLYLFGNNVNDKLGHTGYLCLYLSGAVFSGIGHSLASGGQVLGASGAVAAVTGAYLVLFPQTLITVFYWFFFIGTFELPALYFIAFKLIILDNVIIRYTPSNVAYDAHLAGYAAGIGGMLALLATGLLKGSGFDLLAMIRRWNRRRVYRDVVSSGYDPFTGRVKTAKPIKAREVKGPSGREDEGKITEIRNEIGRRIGERNIAAAASSYLELMGIDSGQVLPRQYLLDIANQLASERKHAESAQAYEQFLAHYGNYEYSEQVELMVGILYSRYLNDRKAAAKHLRTAAEKLTDPGQLKLCREELSRLEG